jgi:hypothetical protein
MFIYLHNYCVSGHYPSSCLYLKHSVLETGFCLRLQVEPTKLGPIDYTEWNERMNTEYRLEKNMKGSGHGLMWGTTRNLPDTEENQGEQQSE